ncbi:hypothetical protein HUG17_1014 [Dermatophagoides farinae]|uniref:BED-type domain-containing protein n=1 Tax=Dermatophagoides farinae TaxID=6954 RepID=A0A9D4P653_DERFA|nr:hypothetical protein HUG17_1014 [Dermatophagoides farinae]
MSESKTKSSRSPIWHYFEPVDVKNTKCLLCQSTYLVRVVPLPHARSEVWTYFGFVANDDGQIMDRTKVVCKICASTFCYSGNTTNFYSHLKSMHSEVQMRNISSKTARQMKRSYSNFLDDGGDSMDAVGTSNDSYYHHQNNNTGITLDDEPLPDRSLDSIIFVEDITQCLLDFLVTDCRPLCVLQGKGFQRLLRLLAPGYVMPDKQKLSNALRKRYEELRKTEHEPSTMEKFDNLT